MFPCYFIITRCVEVNFNTVESLYYYTYVKYVKRLWFLIYNIVRYAQKLIIKFGFFSSLFFKRNMLEYYSITIKIKGGTPFLYDVALRLHHTKTNNVCLAICIRHR